MGKQFCVTDYGTPNGEALCTGIFQKAVDDCFLSGGGTVLVPGGEYCVGTIRLRSGVTLYLERGAHIKGSRNPEEYCCFLEDALEPFPEEYRTEERWSPMKERPGYDFMNKPCGRWGNAILRAIDAENIAIIGEEGAVIDGQDCFDELGEERYRGPHAISMHGCKNICIKGYTVKDSANWAHALFQCENICFDKVTVEAGHDGIHLTSCKNVDIYRCRLFTGDDCIAGIDNVNVVVSDSELNTACSAFRFGGTNVYIQNCRMYGPARYLFRGSLSEEEKKSGMKIGKNQSHRYNMLSAFTYFADFSREIRRVPENIVVKDCHIENADRFFHYNFSGNEPWQANKPLKSITFENIDAAGIKLPVIAYGDKNTPLTLKMNNCKISFEPGKNKKAFLMAAHCERIQLKQVRVGNLSKVPLILCWNDIRAEAADVDPEQFTCITKQAEEPFCVDWI